MVDEGKYYFMARPPQVRKVPYGIHAKAPVSWKERIVRGVCIAKNRDYEWKEHPVILIDFNKISHDTPKNLKLSLTEELQNMAQTHFFLGGLYQYFLEDLEKAKSNYNAALKIDPSHTAQKELKKIEKSISGL